jgi:hypothetical protein
VVISYTTPLDVADRSYVSTTVVSTREQLASSSSYLTFRFPERKVRLARSLSWRLPYSIRVRWPLRPNATARGELAACRHDPGGAG